MKTKGPSKIKFLSLIVLSFLIMYSCYAYHNYYTYNSISVVVKENAAIEYGSANYDVKDLIKKVEGEIVSVKTDINPNVIGEQEVVVEVKKNNIVKDVPIKVEVKDTNEPVVAFREEKVSITQGDNYDLNDNISSVHDDVDGDIPYNDQATDESLFYYNFSFDAEEKDNVGEHEITVYAKDKTGNLTTSKYILEVKERPVVNTYSNVSYNAPASSYGNDVVSIAYSLLGSPYIGGSNGPYGFDCSGFVQYVYSRVGVGVSRSSYTQIYDGVGVSYENAQPGDILSWGYGDGTVTHSALYVGNGMMIHAANPGTGVILSSVNGWLSGSGTTILGVRRVN